MISLHRWKPVVTYKKINMSQQNRAIFRVRQVCYCTCSIKPYQLAKYALYRKRRQYGFKLSIKLGLLYARLISTTILKYIIWIKIEDFTIFQFKIKIFCYENKIHLKYFADIRFDMF